VKGVATYYYRKIRKRNEALDCRVYALAALEKSDPQWARLARRLAKQAAEKLAVETAANAEKPKLKNTLISRPPRRRGGFVNGWK
jgi:phage terminase large subunit GpA-like protein